MESVSHPNVEIFWNIFPVSLFVWLPFRWLLNFIIFPIYIFTWWVPAGTNLIFESLFAVFQTVAGALFFLFTIPLNIIPFYPFLYVGELITLFVWNLLTVTWTTRVGWVFFAVLGGYAIYDNEEYKKANPTA